MSCDKQSRKTWKRIGLKGNESLRCILQTSSSDESVKSKEPSVETPKKADITEKQFEELRLMLKLGLYS